MSHPDAYIWGIIAALGLGTYLIRFSFLGLIGGRRFPAWALRLLRYTPVAVLPGLVAPLVVWPAATQGAPDPLRLSTAALTLAVGYLTRSTILAIAVGFAWLWGGLWLGL